MIDKILNEISWLYDKGYPDFSLKEDREILYDYLVKHATQLKRFDYKKDVQLWHYIIQRSCENKIEVVQNDEKESNLRAILNFGHTIGHGLEAYFNYSTYKHGECVAMGMVAATFIAEKKQLISFDTACAMYNLIKAYDYHLILLKEVDLSTIFVL